MAPKSQSAIWEMVVCKSVYYVGVQAGQLAGYVQIFNVAAHPSP